MTPIVSTPGYCSGSPRIDGTRLTCANVAHGVQRYGSPFGYLDSYPHIELLTIKNCLQYCARQQCLRDGVHCYCEGCVLDKRPVDADEGSPEEIWRISEQLLQQHFPLA